jgi:putative salt-induced outer membrane protein YdiY
MISLAPLVAVLLSADPAADAARAAAAAEKAAQAAAVAAEAAVKAAEAAARVSGVVPAKLSVPAAPAAAAPAAAAKPSPWTGSVGLGLISLTGNSRTVTFTTNAQAERKTTDWIAGTKLYATYGQNRVNATETTPARTETVAEAAGMQLRLDRRFAERYSAYVLGAADTDHVKSIELRSTGEVGASILWVDAGGDSGWKTTLKTDLGFRVANEVRHQYYPTSGPADDATLYAPRAALAFKYALSKDVLFSEDAEIMPNVVGDSRVVVNSLSKISTRLSRTLAFGVAFAVNHDSRPAAPKVATDTSLALTLDALL